MTKVKAFPVYGMARGYEERAEAVEHPDTGKWWFRRTQRKDIFLNGTRRSTYPWTPWECPEDQPPEPYKGMRRRNGYAMLPVE